LYFYYNNKVYILTNDSQKNLKIGVGDKMSNDVCDGDGNIVLIACDIDAGKFTKEELAKRGDKDFMYINLPSMLQDGNTFYINSMVGGPLGPGGSAKLVFE
jgi:hypothetical protein